MREIVGLDMPAVKEAFEEYLNNTNLDSRQIYINQGSIVEMFRDLSLWMGIRKGIARVNTKASAA